METTPEAFFRLFSFGGFSFYDIIEMIVAANNSKIVYYPCALRLEVGALFCVDFNGYVV